MTKSKEKIIWFFEDYLKGWPEEGFWDRFYQWRNN